MLVSVVIITYNHEKYISEAILGVLLQNCNFDVELIIANDCSLDSTDEIVKNIISSHENSGWIKYTRHKVNKGPSENTIWALEQVRGKYVAFCEGDDYWTNPFKLQRQVDYLENNINYSFCFHRVAIQNETLGNGYSYPIPKKSTLTFTDILFKHYIPTCSLVFRASMVPCPLPSWLRYSKMCDIPLELFLAERGYIYFFDEVLAVYRLNENGITQNKEHIKSGRKAYEYLYLSLRNYFSKKYYLLFTILIFKNKLGSIFDLFKK